MYSPMLLLNLCLGELFLHALDDGADCTTLLARLKTSAVLATGRGAATRVVAVRL